MRPARGERPARVATRIPGVDDAIVRGEAVGNRSRRLAQAGRIRQPSLLASQVVVLGGGDQGGGVELAQLEADEVQLPGPGRRVPAEFGLLRHQLPDGAPGGPHLLGT